MHNIWYFLFDKPGILWYIEIVIDLCAYSAEMRGLAFACERGKPALHTLLSLYVSAVVVLCPSVAFILVIRRCAEERICFFVQPQERIQALV